MSPDPFCRHLQTIPHTIARQRRICSATKKGSSHDVSARFRGVKIFVDFLFGKVQRPLVMSRPSVPASYKKLKGILSVTSAQIEWIPTPGQSSATPVTIPVGLIRRIS
jgi:hypothetical protein